MLLITLGTDTVVVAQGNLNNRLRGDYRFSFFRSCVADSSGFTTGLARMSEGSGFFTPMTFAVAGTIHLNGDGTGTISGQELALFVDRNAMGDIPVFQADVDCNLTHTVSPDGSFTADSTCQVSVGAGANAGATFTHGGVSISGHATQGGALVLLSNTSPSVETVDFESSTISLICNRSGFAAKVR